MRNSIKLLLPLLLSIVLLGSGCDPGRSAPPPDGPLKFTGVTVNKARATIGDDIQIHWDYEYAQKLKSQKITVIRQLFQGICPNNFCPNPIPDLPNNARDTHFAFQGPVTVVMEATDNADKKTSLVFDIPLTEDFYFTADVETTNVNYPRLGYPAGSSSKRITFSQFLGIYNNQPAGQQEDGIIDWLARNPSIAAFMPSNEEFRAFSYSEFEREQFRMRQGSAFPLLDPSFRASEDPNGLLTRFSQADGIIFGGATAYDGGTVTTIKTPQGEIEARENVRLCCESIFLQIDLRSYNPTPTTAVLYISDIKIGNLDQQLVISPFKGLRLPDIRAINTLGQHSVTYTLNEGETIGIISGNIKAAAIADDRTDLQGTIILANVILNDVSWNAPFYPDTDLGYGAQVN